MKQSQLFQNQVTEYAVQLVAERQLNGPIVTGPADIAKFACDYLRTADREHFVAIALATSNRIIAVSTCHVGSVNASIVRPADVYKFLVLSNAAAAVFAHNHPSGNLEPSAEDIAVTRQLVEAGRVLGIRVLDHVIVSPEGGFTSLAERGAV